MKDFKNKIAVVTGGGTGMGRELVLQLAEEGCHVAMCDVIAENMEETFELVTKQSPDVLVTKLAPPPIPALLKRRLIVSVSCCDKTSSLNLKTCSSSDTSHICFVTNISGDCLVTISKVSSMFSAITSHIAT